MIFPQMSDLKYADELILLNGDPIRLQGFMIIGTTVTFALFFAPSGYELSLQDLISSKMNFVYVGEKLGEIIRRSLVVPHLAIVHRIKSSRKKSLIWHSPFWGN